MAEPASSRPIVLSLGDPAGVGPELTAAAWSLRNSERLHPFAVVGDGKLLQAAARSRGLDLPIAAVARIDDAAAAFASALPVLPSHAADYTPGVPDPSGAAAALRSLETATGLALRGEAGALVTAPIAKDRLAALGFAFPGQTEFLAQRCGVARDDAVMMLAGPSVRTVPVTIHCALSEVPGRLSIGLIAGRARIAAIALARDFGIPRPRLAIAGLNPHAGENGTFGDEEASIIAPAIAMLRGEGLDVTGPHAADALFAPHKRGSFDAALCMYHDQALIPVKALDFDQGVNCTLGLPIVRTSPDHGTAFDIAGKGIADPGAMIAAIRMAGDMAARRAHG